MALGREKVIATHRGSGLRVGYRGNVGVAVWSLIVKLTRISGAVGFGVLLEASVSPGLHCREGLSLLWRELYSSK